MEGLLNRITENDRIHFVGVGGVSMSALAEILLSRGMRVSGSDINHGEGIKRLEEKGLEYMGDHKAENVKNAAAVIYTVAVKDDNPELAEAKKAGIPLIQRSVFLGEIMKAYKLPIAVAGTHGKTTVTSMLSYIYEKTNCDPTILVGADLDIIGGNLKIGKNDYFIAEACEYHRSFLDFNPYCAAILNAEPDHLDYYKDAEDYHSAFRDFMGKISKDGFAVINGEDEDLVKISESADCRVLTYGVGDRFDFCIKNITADETGTQYDLVWAEGICRVGLSIYGTHNITNSAAALAIAVTMGVNPEKAAASLEDFGGADRRLEYKGTLNGAKVYDDYAHHPTEIAATLEAAEMMPHNKLICVFQPHTYSRTKSFFDEFARAFASADTVIFADIYAAREKDDGTVSSEMLTAKAKGCSVNAFYHGGFDKIADYLKKTVCNGDLVLIMGAGDIVKLTPQILDK